MPRRPRTPPPALHRLTANRDGDGALGTPRGTMLQDDTLVTTKSGKTFAAHAGDWIYWHPSAVVAKLQELVRDGYQLVIVSNQKGISSERDKGKGKGPGEKERSILGRFDQFLEKVAPFVVAPAPGMRDSGVDAAHARAPARPALQDRPPLHRPDCHGRRPVPQAQHGRL